jgi:hypothetical protein
VDTVCVLSAGREWIPSVCCQPVGSGYRLCVVSRKGVDTVCVLSAGREWIPSACCQPVGSGYRLRVVSR